MSSPRIGNFWVVFGMWLGCVYDMCLAHEVRMGPGAALHVGCLWDVSRRCLAQELGCCPCPGGGRGSHELAVVGCRGCVLDVSRMCLGCV